MAIENNNNKVLNVPALRFPEFTDEWIFAPLYDYLEVNKERNRNDEFNKGAVLSVSGDYGIVNQIQHLGRSFAGSSVRDYHVVRKGNIVYTKSPLKEYPYGIVKVNKGNDGIVSTLYAVYSVKHNAVGGFIESYFALPKRTNRYFKPIVRIGAKHDMKIGNEEAIANIVCFPSYTEQRKIAAFISLLDQRISVQTKIIEKLQSLIKGIIETVISSQKSNTAITNCLECNSSTLQESQVAENGTFPVYGATGISGYTEAPDVKGESILIVKDGSGVGTVKYATGEYSYIGTLNRLTVKEGYCIKYIYFALQGFSFEQYKTGMAIPHIYFKDYGKARIYCPSYKLQSTISQQLSCIESKIDVEKRMLSDLLQQKSYLLSQMFI